MAFWKFILAASLTAACLAGCASDPKRGTSRFGRSSAINEIHLFGVPMALNFDATPEPDGIGVRIYASNQKRARGLPITSGTLELMMFEGPLQEDEVRTATPRRVWSFPAADLKGLAIQTSIGIGYRFALRWDDAKPTGTRITVIARYRPTQGEAIFSTPSAISIAPK
jgi:hypothetical protein